MERRRGEGGGGWHDERGIGGLGREEEGTLVGLSIGGGDLGWSLLFVFVCNSFCFFGALGLSVCVLGVLSRHWSPTGSWPWGLLVVGFPSRCRGCGRHSCCCRCLVVGVVAVVPIVLSVAVDAAVGKSVRNFSALRDWNVRGRFLPTFSSSFARSSTSHFLTSAKFVQKPTRKDQEHVTVEPSIAQRECHQIREDKKVMSRFPCANGSGATVTWILSDILPEPTAD